MRHRSLAPFVISALLAGCTSDVEPLTPAQRQAVAEYVSKVAPSPQHALSARFGDAIELLGYDADRSTWRPGQTLRITWYWHALRAPGKGVSLVTQVEDDAGRVLDQHGNSTLRWLYGPDRWRAGEYVRDVQQLHLPDDWAAKTARIYVGSALNGEPLRVSNMPESDGRVLGASIPTTPSEEAPRPTDGLPRIAVVETRRPPRLDGQLDDPVWSFAETTRALVDTRSGERAAFRAFAKLLWDRRYLYVGVDVEDDLLLANMTEHDEHLWEQDCVELMIAPGRSGRRYFEIQVSPRGVVFDARYDSRRSPKPFGRVDWSSRARAGASIRGTLDDDVGDAGYSVEIAIPWQAFSVSPPAIGDTWRANVYVMDSNRDGQRAAAWSPPKVADFHVPGRFGILAFEGAPSDMVGANQPKTIPRERMPVQVDRGDALDRGLKDKLIRKQAADRRQPGEPPPRIPSAAEDLESGEPSH